MVEIIRNICKKRKIHISKLEQDLGFSRGYIYKLDKSKPSISNAKKIADYLSINLSDLFVENEED